jgi:Flp pilus assembly protein TadD
MKRALFVASLLPLTASALAAACSPMQTVTYSVHEPDGRTVVVDKYFSSVTTDDPGDTAFKQIKAAHIDEAMATLRAAVASAPGDSSYHYDIAIIYEIKADWPAALNEIRECRRLRPKDTMYADEEAFILRHGAR